MAKHFRFFEREGYITLRYIDEPLALCIFSPDEFQDFQVALCEYIRESLKEHYSKKEDSLPIHLL